jgi:hypothetical protein
MKNKSEELINACFERNFLNCLNVKESKRRRGKRKMIGLTNKTDLKGIEKNGEKTIKIQEFV